MFGVPPSKLGISMGQANTYSNLESENAAFVQDSLLPLVRKIEAAVDAVLPVGTDLKIDFRQLLRGDTQTRYTAYQIGLAAGFLTVDEVRDWEDLAPLTAATADPPPAALPPAPTPAPGPDL
jgi:HK97 family phage portal protein